MILGNVPLHIAVNKGFLQLPVLRCTLRKHAWRQGKTPSGPVTARCCDLVSAPRICALTYHKLKKQVTVPRSMGETIKCTVVAVQTLRSEYGVCCCRHFIHLRDLCILASFPPVSYCIIPQTALGNDHHWSFDPFL
jgi:hypothetical protein